MSRNSEERGFDLDEGRPGGGAPRGRTGGRRFRRRKICRLDRKSTRLNSSHSQISYAVFCLKKKKETTNQSSPQPAPPIGVASARQTHQYPCISLNPPTTVSSLASSSVHLTSTRSSDATSVA